MMDTDPVPFLLVTANVGSVFEDPEHLLKTWTNEFLAKVALLKPQFIALHLQEVGGKTYEKSMEYVQEFITILCKSNELEQFNKIRVYLDEDYTSAEHFTALGNLYFASKTLQTVKIWNFLTHEWEMVDGKNIHTGNIEAVPSKEKSKFPQHFFPECKWSRKGFLRTRWEIKGTVFDMVNIHLFHDASNLAACEENPSVYCKSRRRALVHTLERFHTDKINGTAPFFVFGDFNFRCDTEGVIKKLTEELSAHRVTSVKSDHTKMQYRNIDGDNVLTVGKKEFFHADHQTLFKESWLQHFDRELEPLKEVLVEYPITFPPTYPYEEDPTLPRNYMSTRCPAWCDRILMNPLAKDLIVDNNFSSRDYNIIGENICMGDHKPVYLNIRLKVFQGTVRCSCEHVQYQQQYINDAYKCSITKIKCLHSSPEYYKILLDCLKLSRRFTQNPIFNLTVATSQPLLLPSAVQVVTTDGIKTTTTTPINDRNNVRKPRISINLTDAENENVCMCSVYSSSDNLIINQISGMDGRICSQCRHIIKQQPTEHRKTLISKRLQLENDIIVNRVDTHLLSLNTFVNNKYIDPYTPESAESHSPVPESQDGDDHDHDHDVDNDDDDDAELNNKRFPKTEFTSNQINEIGDESITKNIVQTTSKGVSPSQLKSRLKNLQRPLHKSNSIRSNNSKDIGCFNRYCVLM